MISVYLLLDQCNCIIKVSIHAPTRGATGWKATFDWFFEFQSTPPHEGRLILISHKAVRNRFNPRPHTRGDSHRHTLC